jgi:hypothetical protein
MYSGPPIRTIAKRDDFCPLQSDDIARMDDDV